jgi:large subunit ribosomal protein L4
MSQARVFDGAGKETGTVELSDEIFNAPIHEAALHQALLRQLANARQGTHQTKTRGEVSGGGKKPWKQKGTGRARQGSTRAPQWRHGGTVFGPHPRGYEQKMPRKQRRLALRAALALKSQGEQLRVLEGLALEAPRTGQMADLFVELGSGAKTLFVLPAHDLVVEKSTRNLPWVRTILAQNLNVFDVLEADLVVLTREALTQVEAQLA